jgi:hypothetical protein
MSERSEQRFQSVQQLTYLAGDVVERVGQQPALAPVLVYDDDARYSLDLHLHFGIQACDLAFDYDELCIILKSGDHATPQVFARFRGFDHEVFLSDDVYSAIAGVVFAGEMQVSVLVRIAKASKQSTAKGCS